MQGFSVTYEIVTPESAEEGDAAERGFVLPGEWKVELERAIADKAGTYTMSLREASNLCYPDQDSGRWFDESDGRHDYKTGAVETRSLHPPDNVTGASYARLKRLFKVR